MNIVEFENWAKGNGFVMPLMKEEVDYSVILKGEKTGNMVHTFISPGGRFVGITCDTEGIIVDAFEATSEFDSEI